MTSLMALSLGGKFENGLFNTLHIIPIFLSILTIYSYKNMGYGHIETCRLKYIYYIF